MFPLQNPSDKICLKFYLITVEATFSNGRRVILSLQQGAPLAGGNRGYDPIVGPDNASG